jgi:hypothetical protein
MDQLLIHAEAPRLSETIWRRMPIPDLPTFIGHLLRRHRARADFAVRKDLDANQDSHQQFDLAPPFFAIGSLSPGRGEIKCDPA